ncbi:MAG: prephenate dehydrogenase/arogenate dehydrogenase family protein [Nitrosospira sp.]|nr:prephenate dehydrogenase/arogenate dehydrogenase family protein [Nitrosospira sp.]MBI0414413.1 prephenate dehydrogenase/arogenate dehydrogenase family protein [Nitrosospira sp.]MBI0415724.1 prephenate dehydrogenase/arogenate dehydrogenase family protein [Nitrosospira sp.]MBI0416944.1 prephenate dehydrogenase/arogenate dehydrogenase family protein [Nitrosospira sp.]MBI0418645.1 prephenate dehydrogenase/arogenate dehydrogenase family protein [Nitrosospira sp.]
MTEIILNKLVIIGVGLIGGSFALALRRASLVEHIVGIGRSRENLLRAKELGVIDEIANDLQEALKDADLVLLAVPVGQIGKTIAQISLYLESKTIVTDVGSTKQDVIIAARSFLAHNLRNFVPSHPIAGTELSGVNAANANLFHHKHLILTPLEETSVDAIHYITRLWQSCGARISQMQASQHDEIFATMSHLPHILAFTLMNHVCTIAKGSPSNLLRFAGTSFLDFTRIASSSPEMWRDICLTNQASLLCQIDAYQDELATLRKMLANNDGVTLEKTFSNAQAVRHQWLKDKS